MDSCYNPVNFQLGERHEVRVEIAFILVHAQFLPDMVSVTTDGVHAHVEKLSNLLSCHAISKQKDDFHFFRGESAPIYFVWKFGDNLAEIFFDDVDEKGLVLIQRSPSEHTDKAKHQFVYVRSDLLLEFSPVSLSLFQQHFQRRI